MGRLKHHIVKLTNHKIKQIDLKNLRNKTINLKKYKEIFFREDY